MSEGTLAPGTVLARKFRVVSVLGEGGMGAVYEIEHELTKHRRALKLLHKSMAELPSVVERFLREASAAGRVGNPHIVETFDAGVLDTGEPYLVMEILRGEPLSSRIARGPMPVRDVVDLVGQACGGVQAAHEAGIVHRDLKPDNLFITEGTDGRPFVKLVDFGISKFDPQKTGGLQLTQEGAALGTPYYMPPEQIRGEGSLDARADVYALGVILYECLAGARPFEAETLPALAIMIHTGQPVPIAQHRPDLPPGFAELVHAAMASDRTKRIQTAADLRAALERYGEVGFRTQVREQVAPPSAVPAHYLATSGAGVSMQAPKATPSSQRPVLIALGGVGLALVAAVGGGLWMHQGRAPAEGSASAPPLGLAREAPVPPTPPSATTKLGEPSVAPTLIETVAAPAPSASAAAPTARPTQSAVPSAPPHAAPARQAGRADQRGLAQDNPFK